MKATWDASEDSDFDESSSENEIANLCLMAHENSDNEEICPKITTRRDKWFLDSGCSRHMTRDYSKFNLISKIDGGFVTFGDNAKRKLLALVK